jgi:hypothetical protein
VGGAGLCTGCGGTAGRSHRVHCRRIGHKVKLNKENVAKRITEGRPTAVGIGQPRLSWQGDVREDLG